MSELIEKIIKEIEHFAPVTEQEHIGRITAVGDGVVSIEGLERAIMSEVILFEQTENKKLKEDNDRLYNGLEKLHTLMENAEKVFKR